MSTQSERPEHLREVCLDRAASALATCYRQVEETEAKTAPAEAEAV